MHPPWWQKTSVYQIYPRSFADTNGDGIGDLVGIIGALDYLSALGVETLWLSPFFKSPQKDFGYDIADHHEIAAEYGTLADCRRLLDEAHKRGLRVVLDMVLNHTSDEHPWFQASRRSKDNPYRDYYIWRPGRKPRGKAPPNNWRSLIGPRGWQYDAASGEWFYASFLPFQPDLNYRNPAVQSAMLDVVRHWFSAGFDGMRLDIFNCLFKDPRFLSNPFSTRPLPSEDNPDGFFQNYRHTVNHPDTLAFARTLRRVVDEFQNPPRFLIGEVFGPPSLLRHYCRDQESGADGLHLVFLFKSLTTPFSAPAFSALIAEFEREFPAPLLPTYVFGNHDRPRWSERIGPPDARAKVIATLQLTVRGVPFIYYGEELGMQNLDLPLKSALDPLAKNYSFIPERLARFLRKRGILINRDECRSPMQWSSAPHAGFSEAVPWLPVHPLYQDQNVEKQTADRDSLFHCYKRLLALRKTLPALTHGSLTLIMTESPDVLGYRRVLDGKSIDVRLNFSPNPHVVAAPRELLFSTALDAQSEKVGRYTLRPYEAIVTR